MEKNLKYWLENRTLAVRIFFKYAKPAFHLALRSQPKLKCRYIQCEICSIYFNKTSYKNLIGHLIRMHLKELCKYKSKYIDPVKKFENSKVFSSFAFQEYLAEKDNIIDTSKIKQEYDFFKYIERILHPGDTLGFFKTKWHTKRECLICGDEIDDYSLKDLKIHLKLFHFKEYYEISNQALNCTQNTLIKSELVAMANESELVDNEPNSDQQDVSQIIQKQLWK